MASTGGYLTGELISVLTIIRTVGIVDVADRAGIVK